MHAFLSLSLSRIPLFIRTQNRPGKTKSPLTSRERATTRALQVPSRSSKIVMMRFYEEEEEDSSTSAGPTSAASAAAAAEWGPYERVLSMARGNAVVVFSASGCCMCHVVKRLLLGLGVGPTVYEVDREGCGPEIQAVLCQLASGASSGPGDAGVPAVFVGGKLLGGVEKVMACHINGSLVPLLKQAGALWL